MHISNVVVVLCLCIAANTVKGGKNQASYLFNLTLIFFLNRNTCTREVCCFCCWYRNSRAFISNVKKDKLLIVLICVIALTEADVEIAKNEIIATFDSTNNGFKWPSGLQMSFHDCVEGCNGCLAQGSQ